MQIAAQRVAEGKEIVETPSDDPEGFNVPSIEVEMPEDDSFVEGPQPEISEDAYDPASGVGLDPKDPDDEPYGLVGHGRDVVEHGRSVERGRSDGSLEAPPPFEPSGVSAADVEMTECFVADPVPEILSCASEYMIQSVVDALTYKASVFTAIEDGKSWVDLRMNNKLIQLQRPKFVRDDTNGDVLDPDMTTEGMVKEIRALDSLRVGDLVSIGEAEEFAKVNNIRVLSTRWVSVGKRDGETKAISPGAWDIISHQLE